MHVLHVIVLFLTDDRLQTYKSCLCMVCSWLNTVQLMGTGLCWLNSSFSRLIARRKPLSPDSCCSSLSSDQHKTCCIYTAPPAGSCSAGPAVFTQHHQRDRAVQDLLYLHSTTSGIVQCRTCSSYKIWGLIAISAIDFWRKIIAKMVKNGEKWRKMLTIFAIMEKMARK